MYLTILILLRVCCGVTTAANTSLMFLNMEVQQYHFICFNLVSAVFLVFYFPSFADVLLQDNDHQCEKSIQNILEGTESNKIKNVAY